MEGESERHSWAACHKRKQSDERHSCNCAETGNWITLCSFEMLQETWPLEQICQKDFPDYLLTDLFPAWLPRVPMFIARLLQMETTSEAAYRFQVNRGCWTGSVVLTTSWFKIAQWMGINFNKLTIFGPIGVFCWETLSFMQLSVRFCLERKHSSGVPDGMIASARLVWRSLSQLSYCTVIKLSGWLEVEII